MSRFDDLDNALRQQAAIAKDSEDARRRAIFEARNSPAMETLLRGSYDLFGDWYQTVIQPRTDLALVLKKKEQPEPPDHLMTEDHYIYRANLVPQNDFPLPGSIRSVDTFHIPGKVDAFDWNPNVALQFNAQMTGHYDKQGKVMGFDARVFLRTWGKSQSSAGEVVDPDLHVSIGDQGWNKIGTTIIIPGNLKDPTKTSDNVQSALTIITPNVLRHRENVLR